MDYRYRASSNFSPNIVSETGSTGFVEDLVRLQAEAPGDDFLLDLGGAAEDGRHHRHYLGQPDYAAPRAPRPLNLAKP